MVEEGRTELVSSLLHAVQKNKSFKALASYSLKQLVKVMREGRGQDVPLDASSIVISVFEMHPTDLEMLECVGLCLSTLAASDGRHALAIVSHCGLQLLLQSIIKDNTKNSTAVSSVLLTLETVMLHQRARRKLFAASSQSATPKRARSAALEVVHLCGEFSKQRIALDDRFSVTRCLAALEMLTNESMILGNTKDQNGTHSVGLYFDVVVIVLRSLRSLAIPSTSLLGSLSSNLSISDKTYSTTDAVVMACRIACNCIIFQKRFRHELDQSKKRHANFKSVATVKVADSTPMWRHNRRNSDFETAVEDRD